VEDPVDRVNAGDPGAAGFLLCIVAAGVHDPLELRRGFVELDVDYTGDALDVGFNVTYLLDVLSNLKTENVRAEFGDANSSALISVPDDERFKYVVMPMRI
jgi:DNA polymerase III sliding clamp (beta) subunit (PCNA family)